MNNLRFFPTFYVSIVVLQFICALAADLPLTASILLMAPFTVFGAVYGLWLYKKSTPLNEEFAQLEQELIKNKQIDLTFRFDESKDLPQAMLVVNACLANIEQQVGKIHLSASRLRPMSEELRDTYTAMTQKATMQSAHGDSVANSITQLLDVTREVDNYLRDVFSAVSKASGSVSQTRKDAQNSQTSMAALADQIEQTSAQISTLKQDSDKISSVIDVINSIAEQTNLLALNAAIEAARAGEQGRGFAVVADEVRNLAARTSKSTQEVRDMVSRIQQGTDAVNKLMLDALHLTQDTVRLSGEATSEVDQIEQEMVNIEQLCQNIQMQIQQQEQLSDTAQTDVESMQELNQDALSNSRIQAVSSQDLTKLAESIQTKIAFFKLHNQAENTQRRQDTSRVHRETTSTSGSQQAVAQLGEVELF